MHGMWLCLATLVGVDGTPTVSIEATRVRLGALVQGLREPWAEVDLGPAPQPLQSRVWQRATVEARIHQAGLPPLPVAVPPRIRVVRAGQRVSEARLRDLVYPEVVAALPPGATLRRLVLTGGVVLGRGTPHVCVPPLHHVHTGEQSALITIVTQDGGGPAPQAGSVIPVLLDLDVPTALHQNIITRGQQVVVVVNAGAVHLESRGVAQMSAALGNYVAVMPQNGTRLLQGQVVDAQTVEVLP